MALLHALGNALPSQRCPRSISPSSEGTAVPKEQLCVIFRYFEDLDSKVWISHSRISSKCLRSSLEDSRRVTLIRPVPFATALLLGKA